MLGLFCNVKYGAMTNYNDRDDDGDDDADEDGNEDGNDNDNAASGSGYYGTIFNTITIIWYGGGVGATMGTALRPRRTMYLRVGLYIYSIKTLLKMCHKLLYAKFGVFE